MPALMLPEDSSFSLSAYVTSLGPQMIALSGYLIRRRSGQTWVTPILPQMFYGADGSQLGHTWRQNLTTTGDQVILSRGAGGDPKPLEEIYWRKVAEEKAPEPEVAPAEVVPEWPPVWKWVAAGGVVAAASFLIGAALARKRR